MILTLTATWHIHPQGPLRRTKPEEDLWSLINAYGSLMSGNSLTPWFLGESTDNELSEHPEQRALCLEFYAAPAANTPEGYWLPAALLATDLALQQAFKPTFLSNILFQRHPGEQLAAPTDTWYPNVLTRIPSGPRTLVHVAPAHPELPEQLTAAYPHLFTHTSGTLTAASWGLTEAAAICHTLSQLQPNWHTIELRATPLSSA